MRWIKIVTNELRFLFLLSLKLSRYGFYRAKTEWISTPPRSWHDVSLVLILNHTSLVEFIYGITLPVGYLRQLSQRLIIPVAKETLANRWFGPFFAHLAPKVVALSRKRDASWTHFLDQVSPNDILIYTPEGRMKRRNGLDKNGLPMTVRGGVHDVLQRFRGKEMVIVYSDGLHHVMAPGQIFPRIFRTISARFEHLKVDDYLAQFSQYQNVKSAIRKNLEMRQKKYCRNTH